MKKNIGMWVVMVLVLAAGVGYAVHSVLASAPPQTPPSPEAILLAEFQQMLGNPGLDADMRRSLEQKAAGLQNQLANQAEASALAAAKNPDRCAWQSQVEAQVDPQRQTGIIEDAQPPFHSYEFTAGNMWQGWMENRWVQVYAGALGSDPTQGVLIVVRENGGGTEWVQAPAGSGGLWLMAESNHRLTVSSTGGQIFYFDVAAMAFADSLEQALPTRMPLPTLSPTADPCAP
jgi:hypothetical protein